MKWKIASLLFLLIVLVAAYVVINENDTPSPVSDGITIN